MSVRENISKNTLIRYFDGVISSEMFWISSFTILTILAAQVTIPVKPVPFTLQTLIVLLAGAFLGSKNGAYSQILYLFLGMIGLPVFAQTADGVGFMRLFGPTGGYLLAFPVAAYVAGLIIEKKKSILSVTSAMISAQLIILGIGSAFLSVYLNSNISSSLIAGALVFSVWDIIKIGAAISIYHALSGKYPRLPY